MPEREYRLTQPRINGRQSAVWYVEWREGGRGRRTSTGLTDEGDARRWLEQLKHQEAEERIATVATVGEIYAAYLAASESEGRATAGATRAWKALAPHFAAKAPPMVTQGTVRIYRAWRLAGGMGPDGVQRVAVQDSTVATDLRYLRAALNWAHREGLIDTVRPFRIAKGRAVRKRWLSKAEFTAIVAHTDELALRVYLEIAIHTASRPEKIYGLRWSDIDAPSRVIYFAEGAGNKRTRPAPINDTLAWVLGCAYQMRQGEYVVERAGRPVTTLRRQFNAVRERAGVDHCTLRDLRTTAASWLVQDGASMEEVAKFLSDGVEVTERHYAHLSPSHLRGVANRLG